MLNTKTLKKLVLLTLCLMTWHGVAFGEPTPQDGKPNRARYLTMPVNGFIGVDTVAGGFERAFKRVSGDPSNRCVVMTFDSVGGSSAQADRIIEVINGTGDRFEKIGVVTRCLGPALGILLTCDRIFIADPQPSGDILEFHRSFPPTSAVQEEHLRQEQAIFRELVKAKPEWKPVIEAMINPGTPLYTWQVAPGQIKTSNTAPDPSIESLAIDLTENLAITAKQAIAAGLAKQLVGGMEGLGKTLGYTTFQPTLTSGATMMSEAVTTESKARSEIENSIERTFDLLSRAEDLVQDLPRQQNFAERADPRNMEYRTSYVRSWNGRRWIYTNSSMSAWKRNTDNAIKQWQILVETLDQIGRIGNETRDQVIKLQRESTKWDADDSRHGSLNILETELEELMSKDASLGVMRRQALSQIEFLRKNRNNPVY
ncbi:MAG: hypothetical protein P8J45_09900 [Phycisphaerales bacterium]|nr:hypothetical protein [Phycisphaerales bacterium]